MRDGAWEETELVARFAAVMHFVAENDGASLARAAKQLGFAQSELLRMLAELGEHGFGLIAVTPEESRQVLHLTKQGRQWLDART
ncbi:MAG TPA: helix-turn-helix domain-containing protein [Arenimonas sp.]|uniref:helix-turn-helix domain-containing protein n=1 Tax=Arenimonas sp. TaxID=1872635 RepID=UPI002B85509C|nr:helix-turn-helix domain-containing protein [Arenimonas sp.]HMB57097.1 helix-turn-helix domain-containing protein [Arenimonas sp.]